MAISFLVIVAAYVICHATTALLVTPIQQELLEDVTVFASLVYLPHGVRILATWLLGWKAVLPLLAGALLSEALITPAETREFLQMAVYPSMLVGAVSGLVAFELFRIMGRDLYAPESRHLNWKYLILVGAVASVFNSAGQSLVYSGLILPENILSTLLVYMIGDVVGLVVTMVGLMFAFRWMRFSSEGLR